MVRGSRFITTVSRVPDEGAARSLVDQVRGEFPDATHHCWAYVAGPPGDTARIGLSDDGEPHGTAGRPILDTLLHSGLGEVAAVVTRYYGGTKLGRGGLGRAYSGGVKAALASLPTEMKATRERVRIRVDYSAVDSLFRFLDEAGAVREKEEYGARVELTARVPVGRIGELERKVAELTAGEGKVLPPEGDLP